MFNTLWMLWNLLLAGVSVLLGRLTYKAKTNRSKILLAFLWLLFVPNTIYILTDLYHLTYQRLFLSGIEKAILFAQYLVFIPLGIITFIYSMNLFEKAFPKIKNQTILIVLINFLIGIGVIIGRFQRTNSWDLFIAPIKTLNDIATTIKSENLLFFGLVFGILCNTIYFLSRKAFQGIK